VEASTDGSILLAGILLKLGFFGIIRFLFPVFMDESIFFTPFVWTLNVASIVYATFSIFLQIDIKKIIAYASIIHMNFACLGLFALNCYGMTGCIYMLFTHGITSSALFATVGFLYVRYNTRLIFYYTGLNHVHPLFCSFFFLFSLSNCGFPGTGGFVSEILIVLGITYNNVVVGLLSVLGVFASSLYTLFLFTRIFYGAPSRQFYSNN